MKFSDLPRFTRCPSTPTQRSWAFLLEWFEEEVAYGLDVDPDFQRGHVWTEDQQIKFIEFMLKGGQGASDIYFNEAKNPFSYVLVDGKQRLTAALKFLRGELRAFGLLIHEFDEKLRMSNAPAFKVYINDLPTKKEVLQWYIEKNTGGVVHTEEEILRVQNMLDNLG